MVLILAAPQNLSKLATISTEGYFFLISQQLQSYLNYPKHDLLSSKMILQQVLATAKTSDSGQQ